MSIINLTDFVPPARYDAIAWERARIEESATRDGSYSTLTTIDLEPLDADPVAPRERSFTANGQVDYWYRVVFVDGNGNESLPSAPIQNSAPEVLAVPSLQDVARILRGRPGAETLWSDSTRPSAADVQGLIDQAVEDLRSRVGKAIPDEKQGQFRHLAILQAGRLYEMTYYADYNDDPDSLFNVLTAEFNQTIGRFIDEARRPFPITIGFVGCAS